MEKIENKPESSVNELENVTIVDPIISDENNSLSTEQIDTESSNVDEYSKTLERIDRLSHLYDKENAPLLEVVQQYDLLIDQIAVLKNKLDTLRTDIIQANELYDSFKRDFANVIESTNWGEKLYYAIPLYEDFDDKDEWIQQWCQVLGKAVTENKENLRIFINKNLYNNVFSLPKDVYYYKANANEVNNVAPKVRDAVHVFSTKTLIFFKFIKDFSDALRSTLLRIVTLDGGYDTFVLEKSKLPSNDKLINDKNYINSLKDEGQNLDEKMASFYNELILTAKIGKVIENPDGFVSEARKLYQKVQDFQNNLNSLSKRLYTDSLIDIYKLYDTVGKSLNDFRQLENEVSDTDEISKLCCLRFSSMLEKILETITKFLRDSYNIIPLAIELNKNFNEYDVNWYDVLVAEDAPSLELTECISSITDTGFAKCNVDGKIEFVTKPAKISVYNKKVSTRISEDNSAV
jgi:hypothetical protein